MGIEPRRSVLGGRRGLLIGLLAVAMVVLIFKWRDLTLAYCLNSAQHALRNRDWAGAAAILGRSNKRGESAPQWHYLQACSLRRTGQVPQAERHFARAAALGWNPADIDRQRLLMKAESGQIKQVEGRLAELVQSEISDEAGEEIYEAMARGYSASFYMTDAARCLQFWINWQPGNPLPHLLAGDVYQRMEKYEAAIAEYRKTLELQPQNREAGLKLALLDLQLANLTEASSLFQACLNSSPQDPEALLGLAECARRQGSDATARSMLYDALLLDLPPQQAAQGLTELGQLANEERDGARAIQLLEHSIALAPSESRSHLALAAALTAAGHAQRAEVERQSARRLTERHNRLVSIMRLIVTEPKNADLRCEAGLILMEQGLASAGADWLRTALQIDAGHRSSHLGLATYYHSIGDLERARRHQSLADKQSEAVPSSKNDEHG